jgi:formylmethanofuran dehydrogenase subunit E
MRQKLVLHVFGRFLGRDRWEHLWQRVRLYEYASGRHMCDRCGELLVSGWMRQSSGDGRRHMCDNCTTVHYDARGGLWT